MSVWKKYEIFQSNCYHKISDVKNEIGLHDM